MIARAIEAKEEKMKRLEKEHNKLTEEILEQLRNILNTPEIQKVERHFKTITKATKV